MRSRKEYVRGPVVLMSNLHLRSIYESLVIEMAFTLLALSALAAPAPKNLTRVVGNHRECVNNKWHNLKYVSFPSSLETGSSRGGHTYLVADITTE
jgi:hypothetical protein